MSEKRIAYITRDYDGCRKAILDTMRKYYPEVFSRVDDASIGQWLVDVMADIYDNLNFHIDRVYQETTIDSASQLSSIQSIARTNGLKIPGKKAALVEVELTCELPLKGDNMNNMRLPDERYCPIIKRGTLMSTGATTFELMEDVNFAEQFNSNGYSNRQMIPIKNSNGLIVGYQYKKLSIASAGQSKVYKRVLTNADIKPFMEVKIQDSDILGVESVIVKQGQGFTSDPQMSDYFVDMEEYTVRNDSTIINRFFEVDNLIDQSRFGDVMEETTEGTWNPISEEIYTHEIQGEELVSMPCRQIVRGRWKRLKNKFITEYTDNWNLNVIFGPGLKNQYGQIPQDAEQFTQYMMSRMYANDYMGVLPDAGSTLYILYRIGGGEKSNIASGTLNSFVYLNVEINGACGESGDAQKKRSVRNSIKVTNTTPSYGGKDEPNEEEIKYMVKYGSCAQNRCVTIDDYYAVLQKLPAKYGSPFRIGVMEENNKVCIYTLGLDDQGKLKNQLAETVADNMKEFLTHYRCINDFVEIKSGKIINVAFAVNVIVDKTYEKGEVVKRIINLVYDYMDIHKHQMGEDIYLGDLQKELNKLDGVKNLVSIKAYNKTGDGYSTDTIEQELVSATSCCYNEYDEDGFNTDGQIDLTASDYTLVGDPVSMYEIKDKNRDIVVNVKTR